MVFRDETRKQRQKTLKARTIQRALAEAEEYRTQIRRGEVLPPSSLTFGDVAKEYFEAAEGAVASGGLAPRTLGRYRQQYGSNAHLKATGLIRGADILLT